MQEGVDDGNGASSQNFWVLGLCNELSEFFFRLVFIGLIYTVSQNRNNTDVTHYNFDADKPILIIFGKRFCWKSMLSNVDLLSHLS